MLVTGVAGFIGRHVARHFTQQGWTVVGVDMLPAENAPRDNLAQYHRLQLPARELLNLLQSFRPMTCIHCAGRASVPESLADPAADFRDNAVLTFDVLDAIRTRLPTCHFILLSSAAIYGNPVGLPVPESAAPAPVSPYGFHKWQCEVICREFARTHGMQVTAVRVFSAYGPGLRRQVLWDICHKALTGSMLVLLGTGAESRDFVHVRDIARALAVVTEVRQDGEFHVYNVASGIETSIRELAELTLQHLGRSVPLEFDGVNPCGYPVHWQADIRKLQALGFTPKVDLTKGVAAYAQWSRTEILGL